MKYRFGVMSQLWELESDDDILAKVAMCLFYKKNVPIGIYLPLGQIIMPKEILEKHFLYCQNNNKKLSEITNSIKEVKENDL